MGSSSRANASDLTAPLLEDEQCAWRQTGAPFTALAEAAE